METAAIIKDSFLKRAFPEEETLMQKDTKGILMFPAMPCIYFNKMSKLCAYSKTTNKTNHHQQQQH